MAKKPNAMNLDGDDGSDDQEQPTPTITSNDPRPPAPPQPDEETDEASLRSEIAAIKRKCDRLGLHWIEVLRQQAVDRSRQGDQHRPYCQTHNVLMRAAKTTSGVTSYACPVPNCKATEKRAQPTSNVPREPQQCPHCAARALEAKQRDAPPVYLEADYGHSTFAMLHMACPTPECHFSVRVLRPDIAARQRVQARRAEQIGER